MNLRDLMTVCNALGLVGKIENKVFVEYASVSVVERQDELDWHVISLMLGSLIKVEEIEIRESREW